MPRQHILLPVQRLVIGVLAGDHVGHQARTGQALVDRPPEGIGPFRGGHAAFLALAAGELRSYVLDHEQRRGRVVQLLADVFADAHPWLTAAGAGQIRRIDLVLDAMASQVRRQWAATMPTLHRHTGVGCGLGRLLRFSQRLHRLGRGRHRLAEQQQLPGVDLL